MNLFQILKINQKSCFSTNQYGLKEFDRGSSKEHFYKIIWKSANQIWWRRFLKIFSFCCHGNQNSAWIPKIWRISGEVNVRMLPVKFHPNWPTGYWVKKVDGRRTTDAGQKSITLTHLEHFVHRWAKTRMKCHLPLNFNLLTCCLPPKEDHTQHLPHTLWRKVLDVIIL